MATGRRPETMNKRNREQAVKEKRDRKRAAKQAAAAARAAVREAESRAPPEEAQPKQRPPTKRPISRTSADARGGYDGRRAVAVAQLVEPRVVVPVVAGSSPVRHPRC